MKRKIVNIKKITLVACLILVSGLVAQVEKGEQILPLTHNYALSANIHKVEKASPNTFDSTFIYTLDTLSLPIFDDFSKNRIQKYNVNHTDAGVTSTLVYRVLDANDVPLDDTQVYTTQQTFRRIYNTENEELIIDSFPPTFLKIAELSTYPVQYQTTAVFPPYYIFDTLGIPDTPDTIWFVGADVVQDSARQFFAHITDTTAYWTDNYAYHNYRYAKNPWSIGVMTFDGLDNNGRPYQMNTALSGVADYLTSKPIDLSTFNPADSVYLTFLFQKQGLGDQPEETDSLILEFYDKTADAWNWLWSTNGGTTEEFQVVQIPVDIPIYFNDFFRFRFKNYGGLSGALDHFHIDYVNLRASSGYQDTLVEDFAVSYPIISLLNDYTNVPWEHYKNNPSGKMSTNVPLVVRNSYLNGGVNVNSGNGGTINVSYGNVLEGTISLNGQSIVNYHPSTQPIPDYEPQTTYESAHDVSSFQYDNTKIGTEQTFVIETIVNVPVSSNYSPNDTARFEQYFGNYYAYDDGTAEQAYGVTGIQAQLAQKYIPYQADSLVGVMIHFVPTVKNVEGKLFMLSVWDDNNGEPGELLYEDHGSALRELKYGDTINAFTIYLVQGEKVPVNGTFYIGFRQVDSENLGIGFDRNTDTHDKVFYNVGAGWEQSQFDGSVMMRPIFSNTLMPDSLFPVAGIALQDTEYPQISIYPNPTSGIFEINSSDGKIGTTNVYSSIGTLIFSSNQQTINLETYPAGIYMVRSSLNPTKILRVVKK